MRRGTSRLDILLVIEIIRKVESLESISSANKKTAYFTKCLEKETSLDEICETNMSSTSKTPIFLFAFCVFP